MVGRHGKMWVAVFAVLTNDLAIVVLVVNQEGLGVLVDINVDLCERRVDGGLLVALTGTVLEPRLDDPKLVAGLHFFNQILSWAASAEVVEDLLDV